MASVGMEGVVFKRLDDPYRPSVRDWQKYKTRKTTEAIVGTVTGPLAAPRTLLLGRYDDEGRLQYAGRTAALGQAAGTTVVGILHQAASAGCVLPRGSSGEVVVEGVAVALDGRVVGREGAGDGTPRVRPSCVRWSSGAGRAAGWSPYPCGRCGM